MENIDYKWTAAQSDKDEELFNIELEEKEAEPEELQTRHNIQIMRRLFHIFNGVFFATLYLIAFSHSQMVHILGTIACVLYLIEQIRIKYPETAAKLLPFTKFVMRAEEQLKESAMMPYAMAILLSIITFPKEIALVAIYTLAFADPLSAIIGIKFGKRKISETRSVEGSLAFFFSTFFVCLMVLSGYYPDNGLSVLVVSVVLGILGTLFDLIPLKIDDNLTIPLFIGSTLWPLMLMAGL